MINLLSIEPEIRRGLSFFEARFAEIRSRSANPIGVACVTAFSVIPAVA